MIRRRVFVDVRPTPKELAFEFCAMDDSRQSAFFNELAEITAKWKSPLCMQLQYITDNKKLTMAARAVMAQIGEYANPVEAPQGI